MARWTVCVIIQVLAILTLLRVLFMVKQHGGLGYTKIRGSTHLQIEDGNSSVIIPILSKSQIQIIHRKNVKRVKKLEDHCKKYSGRTEVRKLYQNEYFIDKDLKIAGCIPSETREYNIQYFYENTNSLAPSRTASTWQREGELNTEDSLDSVNRLITNQGLGEWFIIVRHPILRLIHGWKEFFCAQCQGEKKTNANYVLGKYNSLHPENPIIPNENAGETTIAFTEFLERFVFAEKTKEISAVDWDQRFLGLHRLCLPCLYPYTAILRSENFESEFQWFLKDQGIWGELNDSAKASSTYDFTDAKIDYKKILDTLSHTDRNKLWHSRHKDMETFGYYWDIKKNELGVQE
ncbi:Oidioi.mRNA.OKI2018_I69.chr2.g5787.t1.cds [Oikopleura dioica]|uniref:Carbohydrate sulfotransferase n=1 Tax=Oikopleura dioica TaxID=34765 RepID=A0ABN7T117_OIKDI|nr:Oidioi.mRNA.OKI2018_I69.chr2.g5787.t1.cds [Oikopleura dioica]